MARELSELLGQATVHCQESGGAWKDQESWGITMHGAEIRMVIALLRYLKSGDAKIELLRLARY